jgi:hypothetical protein
MNFLKRLKIHNMKRLLLLSTFLFVLIMQLFPQAKKPVIMVVPSDFLCISEGYVMTFDDMGATRTLPDYRAALQQSSDLLLVIGKINTLMADRGFPLKNLESVLRSIEQQSAEDAMMMSKSGSDIAESPLDALKRVAKADIIMQLTWNVNETGPKRSVTFNLQGLDSYTDKQVAGAQGTGTPSFSAELPVLLEEAVLSHLDNFNAQLQMHFDDLLENGREISMRVRIWSTSPVDLEEEYDGYELGEIIEDWVYENTVQGRFTTTDATENMMVFEQVRIPLYNDRGRAMDARMFAQDLRRFLNRAPYNLDVKVSTRGLGQAQIIIGEK